MALTIAQISGVINFGVVFGACPTAQSTAELMYGSSSYTSSASCIHSCCAYSFSQQCDILVGSRYWFRKFINKFDRSVISRLLNGSWWPFLLRTDTAATSKVERRVLIIASGLTTSLILLAVAAIVTPLGLYNTLRQKSSDETPFAFVRDLSPIGSATPKRDDYNTSRLCGWLMYKACPGQYHGFSWWTNDTGGYMNNTGPNDYISSVVPDNLTSIFSSGRTNGFETVATPFDIQYRTYVLQRNPDAQSVLVDTPKYNIDEQRLRTVGKYSTYESLILANDFVVRDGIVADMKKGGIGFRNHSLPVQIGKGAEWSENLLWVEPETVCISNNITLQYNMPYDITDNQNGYLIDDGGLTILQDGYEWPEYDTQHMQTDPELYARAFKGATLWNYNTGLMLNISHKTNRTHVGKKFNLGTTMYNPGQVRLSSFDLGFPGAELDYDPSNNSSNRSIDQIGKCFTHWHADILSHISSRSID